MDRNDENDLKMRAQLSRLNPDDAGNVFHRKRAFGSGPPARGVAAQDYELTLFALAGIGKAGDLAAILERHRDGRGLVDAIEFLVYQFGKPAPRPSPQRFFRGNAAGNITPLQLCQAQRTTWSRLAPRFQHVRDPGFARRNQSIEIRSDWGIGHKEIVLFGLECTAPPHIGGTFGFYPATTKLGRSKLKDPGPRESDGRRDSR